MKKSRQEINVRDFLFTYGFVIVLVLVVIYFSLASNNFFTVRNFLMVFHTAAPMLILSTGLALVIMTGQLDISVGSIAFLSSGIGIILITRHGVPDLLGLLIVIIIGTALGALNGFIVVIMKVNPLITTMGTMIALRGLALQITNSQVISLPEQLRVMGNARLPGLPANTPIYLDILISFAVLLILHWVHTRTTLGRQITALGNGFEVSERLGVQVKKVNFLAFVISGLMASIGGIFTMFQVGQVSPTMGSGYEFSAIAMLVIGGISLFGGEGTIIPGIILGGVTLTVIESGLNFIGASPYAYPFVRGGIIFVAMFADSLKSLVKPKVKVIADDEPTGKIVGA